MANKRTNLIKVTPPATEPISLQQAKDHLRVRGTSSEDNFILELVQEAREYCEIQTSRSFIETTWDLKIPSFPGSVRGAIELPRGPLKEVQSIQYLDFNGDLQTFDSDDWDIETPDNRFGRVYLKTHLSKSWPSTALVNDAVRIRFVAGKENPNQVPSVAKRAMYLLIGHWYLNRETVVTGTISTELGVAVDSLLNSIKIPIVGAAQ